jgi:hydroxypyruvate reductase
MLVEPKESPFSTSEPVSASKLESPVAMSSAGPLPPLLSSDALHAAARTIFSHALEQCNIGQAFDRHLHFEGTTLVHHPFPALKNVLKPQHIRLDRYRHIRIVSAGKAAVPMLETLLSRLPRNLSYRAICAGPERMARRNWRIHSFAAGHPVPNQESFEAARAALRMLRQSHADTFVFFLLSGGGSSMIELPLDETISLEDTIAFHEALVSSGATIHEMNIVRKHFSAVKGGRLALAAPEAAKLTLQLADVPLRNLDALASGPTIPDRSTVDECREVLLRYGLLERFPGPVRSFFGAAEIEETPGAKPIAPANDWLGIKPAGATAALRAILRPTPPSFQKDPVAFGSLNLDTLLSSHDLVNAARDLAQQLGFKVVIDNRCDDWPYDAAALYLVRRFRQLRALHPRLCLISSGEVTVRLPIGGKIGTGGRNQQFALAAAMVLAGESHHLSAEAHAKQRMAQEERIADPGALPAAVPEAAPAAVPEDGCEHDRALVCVFSAGTDGIDGNSPVAGAVADGSTLVRARALNFDPLETLRSFDACPLFTALGDTVVTGKTGHNLRDLRLLISGDADTEANG